MKVILLKDIPKLGKKHEVKEVADGHVRNLLLPKGLVKEATPEALEWLDLQKSMQEAKDEDALKQAQELASKLDDLEVVISVKVGDEGQLFESVSPQKIAEHLKGMGIEVKKSQIQIPSPIKEAGEFEVSVKLDHNLEAQLHILVQEQKDL
ncbi:MAG: 50S ribosomal protein L9 [bacterium]|nr:50S ribosomal protein L9 [bacterium]